MPDVFLLPPRILRFGHRMVTVSPSLISLRRPRHRLAHLEAPLSRIATQLTLPELNTTNLSTGWAMLLPIARPGREVWLLSGLHLLI